MALFTTVAGNGSSGLVHSDANGDGGPSHQALINGPWSVAVAPDSSLYILEARRVRWIGPDGIIASVVGHPANAGAYPGNGTPATTDRALFNAHGIALGPDQSSTSRQITLHSNKAMARASYALKRQCPASHYHDIAIPASDGASSTSSIQPAGTCARWTPSPASPLYTFAYDPAGRLASSPIATAA